MKIVLGKAEVESMVDMWVYKNFVEKEVQSCKVEDGTITIEVQDYKEQVHKEEYEPTIGDIERGRNV